MKQIIFRDDKSQKQIFDNKEKNELLLYWKNQYIKELEEAIFKEKNKILQEKLESSEPYDKYIEFTKKRRQDKKKSPVRKGYKTNNIFSSPRANIKKYSNTNLIKKKEQKK